MDLTIEEDKILKQQDAEHEAEVNKDPPICKVWRWLFLNGRLVAERYEDHPDLGNGPTEPGSCLLTTMIVWKNLELGMARTRNTLYKLMGPGV